MRAAIRGNISRSQSKDSDSSRSKNYSSENSSNDKSSSEASLKQRLKNPKRLAKSSQLVPVTKNKNHMLNGFDSEESSFNNNRKNRLSEKTTTRSNSRKGVASSRTHQIKSIRTDYRQPFQQSESINDYEQSEASVAANSNSVYSKIECPHCGSETTKKQIKLMEKKRNRSESKSTVVRRRSRQTMTLGRNLKDSEDSDDKKERSSRRSESKTLTRSKSQVKTNQKSSKEKLEKKIASYLGKVQNCKSEVELEKYKKRLEVCKKLVRNRLTSEHRVNQLEDAIKQRRSELSSKFSRRSRSRY